MPLPVAALIQLEQFNLERMVSVAKDISALCASVHDIAPAAYRSTMFARVGVPLREVLGI
ncbi:hypothetical protein [Bradyrhizobium sp. USDA 329]|uniref:hypothetical protein n=1 Tax=unclassified Bradyrhizobium TaxID=2631580 RepID=UPI0035149A33